MRECTVVVCAGNHDLRLLRADLHTVCSFSFIEYGVDVLELTAGATNKVYIISESQIGDRCANDGDGDMVDMEVLLHYLHKDKLKQNGG
ncbi:hypothetical protein DPMN_109998 [Dreissena polymorpha]|uniref:Uncharacterized protein n=1 Tax=Dreissena polymorpha TaxID=45954 RepID=A0A9D4QNH1_DREPO|nr:hypothetical protein DPMN_109998 [Dreissena polymorpha]